VGASEQNEWLRAAWKLTVAGVLNPRRLVFVDECGTHVSLAPLYGYSPKGERTPEGAAQPRQEHDFAGEHEHR
jgi:hypothetical protein